MTSLGLRSASCVLVLWGALVSGCGSPAEQGKIPITTKSEDARREYLLGRDLAEGLQFHNSVAHFEQAIALDPGFASAELGRANAATTAEEFLVHLKKASSLTSGISLGERLLVLATDAGANGQTDLQKTLLDSLVGAYPQDERAQTTLGTYYFGILDYAHAVEHLKAATAIAPKYAPAYNLLGYAHRFLENYPEAEAAFKTYTELIPTEANPYDSYAELLLREGKFDQSIQTYRQALAKDSTFISSKQGVAFNLLYQGKADEAGAVLEKMSGSARDDGEHRQAFFDMAVYHAYRGQLESAAGEIDKEYAVAQARNGVLDMAGDLNAKGSILQEAGKFTEAKDAYDQAQKLVQESTLPQEMLKGVELGYHYNCASLALSQNSLPRAKEEAASVKRLSESNPNPGRVRLTHEIFGMIALAEKDYNKAIEELTQANQQDAYNLYRLALAYTGKGDAAKAKEYLTKTNQLYPLPSLNYAFVHMRAEKMNARSKG